ncbi:hypothetical protein AVEN_89676-1 [Araneus ventricosus]|uniref:Uncharacterized protein n=1 Tax=Araneus ventricosus TaxID=182803 RepID=A0A4Y2NBR1_ARAVE|nr:hypothetical protein AVEN_89676-1 [Araneus ventricosus]
MRESFGEATPAGLIPYKPCLIPPLPTLISRTPIIVFSRTPGFEECDRENIQDWLECDVDDPDYQVLADDEINSGVIDDQDSCDDKEDPRDNVSAERELIQCFPMWGNLIFKGGNSKMEKEEKKEIGYI